MLGEASCYVCACTEMVSVGGVGCGRWGLEDNRPCAWCRFGLSRDSWRYGLVCVMKRITGS